jgi:hypothetical protein
MFGELALITAVRMHCGACGEAVEITGPDLRAQTAQWCASHYQPTPDEMDIATLAGSELCTWRRRSADAS